MYRVGFGDCFLVRVPGGEHLLIDCGVHPAADLKTLGRVVANVKAETNGKLAVVAATHEHADHIAGFGACGDVFAECSIGEVWMPWAMDPADERAIRLARKRRDLAAALATRLRARSNRDALNAVLNIVGNQRALEHLQSRFFGAAGTVRYLAASNQPIEVSAPRGVTVRILGPDRDTRYLKSMDPPVDQRFVAAPGAAVTGMTPLDVRWTVPRERGALRAGLGRARERSLEAYLRRDYDRLAFALDRATNNTSLILHLRIGRVALLFPGDAQWGAWRCVLESVDNQRLLRDVKVLKVSHHGSVNATPRALVEETLPEGVTALVSTETTPWPSIPHPGLISALTRLSDGSIVRSDCVAVREGEKPVWAGALPAGFSAGPFWIDYEVPV